MSEPLSQRLRHNHNTRPLRATTHQWMHQCVGRFEHASMHARYRTPSGNVPPVTWWWSPTQDKQVGATGAKCSTTLLPQHDHTHALHMRLEGKWALTEWNSQVVQNENGMCHWQCPKRSPHMLALHRWYCPLVHSSASGGQGLRPRVGHTDQALPTACT